ncbi:hypothetical protein M0813_15282 [Anaeramoeba flamelloides]|uniref:Uncharacterized protein n=1 Tax=Anaeramoeba flamelloides TaxID=1746091 RepID=A0ABQ8Z2S7_9EUKA|nr:hypothetical protein M0813_15282 [Anaeramoeba flamelloides]
MSQTKTVLMSLSSYENLENKLSQLRDNIKKKQSSLQQDEIFLRGLISVSNNNSFHNNNNNARSFSISQTQRSLEDGGQIMVDNKEMDDSIELDFDFTSKDRSEDSFGGNSQLFEESDFGVFETANNDSLEIQFEDVDEDEDEEENTRQNSNLHFDSSFDLCPTLIETNNFQQDQDQKQWPNEHENDQTISFDTKSQNNQQFQSFEHGSGSRFSSFDFDNDLNFEENDQSHSQTQILNDQEHYQYLDQEQEEEQEQEQEQEQEFFLEFNEALSSSPQTNSFDLMNQEFESFLDLEQSEMFGYNHTEMN